MEATIQPTTCQCSTSSNTGGSGAWYGVISGLSQVQQGWACRSHRAGMFDRVGGVLLL